jgi:ADP-ribose pyrophosphatase YjhB (NUDIX family)
MKDIRQEIEAYIPCNEQEAQDRMTMLAWMKMGGNLYTRENRTAHFTASAWVADLSHAHVLLAYHNIYQSWSWLGGHADGDHDLLHVAMKEVSEESGLTEVRPLSEKIASIEILTVDGHQKHGAYVSSHLHMNVTYLMEADSSQPIRCKEDENSSVAWFGLEEAVEKSSEPWFREHIYPKLNQRLKEFTK